MQCLMKYRWVKLPRALVPVGKGIMGSWARLAARAAFRRGEAAYCGHINTVTNARSALRTGIFAVCFGPTDQETDL